MTVCQRRPRNCKIAEQHATDFLFTWLEFVCCHVEMKAWNDVIALMEPAWSRFGRRSRPAAEQTPAGRHLAAQANCEAPLAERFPQWKDAGVLQRRMAKMVREREGDPCPRCT